MKIYVTKLGSYNVYVSTITNCFIIPVKKAISLSCQWNKIQKLRQQYLIVTIPSPLCLVPQKSGEISTMMKRISSIVILPKASFLEEFQVKKFILTEEKSLKFLKQDSNYYRTNSNTNIKRRILRLISILLISNCVQFYICTIQWCLTDNY